MPTTLRWLLVPFCAAFGCWFGILLALLLHSAFTSLCPADQLVSGVCHASWHPAAEAFSQYAGAAIGAALAVLLPCVAAPSHKRATAAAAFAGGTACAVYFGIHAPGVWPYAASAIVSGLAVLAWVWRRACQN